MFYFIIPSPYVIICGNIRGDEIMSSYLLFIVIIVAGVGISVYESIKIKNKLGGLVSGQLELTPEEFMNFQKRETFNPQKSRRVARYECAGVYILHNTTKDEYYIMKSNRIFASLVAFFSAQIPCDALNEYIAGDKFMIGIRPLEGSGCSNLDDLYNKTLIEINGPDALEEYDDEEYSDDDEYDEEEYDDAYTDREETEDIEDTEESEDPEESEGSVN